VADVQVADGPQRGPAHRLVIPPSFVQF